MTTIESLEVILDGTVALAAGGGAKGLLVAFSFDGYFDQVAKLEFEDKVSRVKRLFQADIFIVGSWGSVFIVQYKDKQLLKLGAVNNLCDGLINWIESSGSELYILDSIGTSFTKIKFNIDLDGEF